MRWFTRCVQGFLSLSFSSKGGGVALSGKHLLLAATLLVALIPFGQAKASLIGDTVDCAPVRPEWPPCDPIRAVVGDGVEFRVTTGGLVEVDIAASSVTLTGGSNLHNGETIVLTSLDWEPDAFEFPIIQTLSWDEPAGGGEFEPAYSGEVVLEFDATFGTQTNLVGCTATGMVGDQPLNWGECILEGTWTYIMDLEDWTLSVGNFAQLVWRVDKEPIPFVQTCNLGLGDPRTAGCELFPGGGLGLAGAFSIPFVAPFHVPPPPPTGEIVGFTIDGALNPGRVSTGPHALSIEIASLALFDPETPSTILLDVVHVPEPTTLALIGLGLAGLGFTRRRGVNA